MEQVGSYEAKTHLAELLDRVARGERITITRYGVPVATLVPVDPRHRRDIREVIAEVREFRKGRRLAAEEARELVTEGRRH